MLGAAVVGSTSGGLAALRLTSPRTRVATRTALPQPARSASPDAAVLDGATAADPTLVASSPQAIVTTQMTAVLTRFTAWSHDHAGAPCPDLATLGLAARDPWGHDLALTCTDQPADQMIGALSAGPDRVLGTDDDVPSWTLGPRVTGLVRGPRRKTSPAALAPSPRPPPRRRTDPPPQRRNDPSAPPRPSPLADPWTPSAPGRTDTPPPSDRATPLDRTAPTTPTKPAPPPPTDPNGDDIPSRRSSR